MSVGDSAEHDELRQVVREFLGERSPSREVRRLMEAGESRDDEVWALLAGQLGLTGIAVPERYGGAGLRAGRARHRARGDGPRPAGGAVLRHRRAGRPGPGRLRRRGRDGALAARHRRRLAHRHPRGRRGIRIVGPGRGRRDRRGRPATAGPSPATKLFVVDGHTADLLLVVAHAPTGPGSSRSRATTPGVERARLDSLDLTRPLASVTLREAPGPSASAPAGTPPAWLSEVTRPGARRAGGRAARRRRPLPGPVGRVRQGPRAVRPPDRLVPGHQAQVREPAARGRVRPVGGVPRERGRSPARSRTRRSPRRSPTSTVRRPSPMPPRSASRSTAASATPGSTTRTCTCGGRSRPSCCSARPRGSGRGWPSWPGSEGRR